MRARTYFLALAVALSCGCRTAGPPLAPPVPALAGVTVSFDSTGKALNIWDQHLAESGDPAHSHDPGSDYWFRLRNDSGHRISFRTASLYIDPNVSHWELLPNGTRVPPTLAEGRRIFILFAFEDRKGRPISYGSDMSAQASLDSGRSVLFSVPHAAFDHSQRVAVDFWTSDASQETGSNYRVAVVPPRPPA